MIFTTLILAFIVTFIAGGFLVSALQNSKTQILPPSASQAQLPESISGIPVKQHKKNAVRSVDATFSRVTPSPSYVAKYHAPSPARVNSTPVYQPPSIHPHYAWMYGAGFTGFALIQNLLWQQHYDYQRLIQELHEDIPLNELMMMPEYAYLNLQDPIEYEIGHLMDMGVPSDVVVQFVGTMDEMIDNGASPVDVRNYVENLEEEYPDVAFFEEPSVIESIFDDSSSEMDENHSLEDSILEVPEHDIFPAEPEPDFANETYYEDSANRYDNDNGYDSSNNFCGDNSSDFGSSSHDSSNGFNGSDFGGGLGGGGNEF